MLPLLIPLLILLSVISYNIPIKSAQEDNTNFLTHTNTNLGFTIKYPSDWSVDESDITNHILLTAGFSKQK
jgi:hypothetical protein